MSSVMPITGVSWYSTSTGPPCLREPAAATSKAGRGDGDKGRPKKRADNLARKSAIGQLRAACASLRRQCRRHARTGSRAATCPGVLRSSGLQCRPHASLTVPRRALQQHLCDGPPQACQHGG